MVKGMCLLFEFTGGVWGMKRNIKVYLLTGKSETGIDIFQLRVFIRLSEVAWIPIISYFVGQLPN